MPVAGVEAGMKISDFSPNDMWDFSSDGLQVLNSTGGTATFEYDDEEYDAIFTYFDKSTIPSVPASGWYHQEAAFDGTWITIEEAGFNEIDYGFAVVYETSDNEAALVFSGAVAKGPQTIGVAYDGWNLIGNPTPVEALYSNITPNDEWDFSSDGLQILNSTGGTETFEYDDEEYDAIFTYFDKSVVPSVPASGWYHQEAAFDGTWITIQEAGFTKLDPGQAVVFETSSNDAAIQFPGAL